MSHHRIHRSHTAVIAVVLAVLLFGVALAAEAVTLLGYQITFNGVTKVDHQTTWTYQVKWLGPDKYELSHWSLEVCVDYLFVSESNELNCTATFGPDPTTGVYGIKWEDCSPQIGPEHTGPYTFSVTLSSMTDPRQGDVQVGVKAGQGEDVGYITGPACSPNAVGLRNFQANTTLVPLAALILASIFLGGGLVLWRRQSPVD